MRPTMGGDALTPRSRKQSFAGHEVTTPTALPGNGTPTTFFMATEDALDASRLGNTCAGSDSTFGVRSLEETVEVPDDIQAETVDQDGEDHRDEHNGDIMLERRRSTLKGKIKQDHNHSSDSLEQALATSTTDSSPALFYNQQWPPANVPQSLTPLSLASPAQGSSFPSSPQSSSLRSYKHSDEEATDDGASQAIASSEEEENEDMAETQSSAPQLIMPSIKMPSRRPFTERGKDIGRLKVLIAGDSGVGKTSLIKSIVQTCEDIVHVDPLSSTSLSLVPTSPRRSKNLLESSNLNVTTHVTEVYASTRPYASWWSEIDESKVLRRRKSSGEAVLERNLCFVDTPGHRHGMSMMEGVETLVNYIEAQMARTMSVTGLSDGDLLNVLGGNGGFQVDVVFYLVSQRLMPVDVEILRRLSLLTSFIPLIAKADLSSKEDIEMTKDEISSQLRAEGLIPFTFNSSPANYRPLSVCSAASNDEDNMDASLLMSPDYVQPLLPSELALLVEQVFEKESISWLRHTAAKKIVQWRKTPQGSFLIASSLQPSLTPGYGRSVSSMTTNSSATSSLPPAMSLVSYPNGPSSYSQAAIIDHTQREERLAQFHLAKWAGDLQRSLQSERARYEALARGERAIWLSGKIDDCITDGTLVPVKQDTTTVPLSGKGIIALRAASTNYPRHHGIANMADPLGIVRWNETMKKRGWIAFQVVGSFGVLGAFAVWVARNWDLGIDTTGWHWNWLAGFQ